MCNHNLTEQQLDILRNKYTDLASVERRLKLLYRIDQHFKFNRRAMAQYLKQQQLTGYSTRQLARLIGLPVFTCNQYLYLKKLATEGRLDWLLLLQLCSKRVNHKLYQMHLGTKRGD